MKTLAVFYSCMLLFSSAAMATLSGSDNFNDNIRDTGKWEIAEPHLAETNARLELTTTGTGDEDGIWIWIANEGSQHQNWTASINVYNTSSTTYGQFCGIGLFVLNSADVDDVFGIILADNGGSGHGITGGWDINGVDYFNSWIPLTQSSATFKIVYDAGSTTLLCKHDTGSGYTTVTNFNVNGWSMGPTDTFQVAIAGWTENSVAVSSGQVYADNFEASSASDISNHIDMIVLSHEHDYANPTTSADDYYQFEAEVDADSSIANVVITTPASEILATTGDGLYDGLQEWWYESDNSSPQTNRFGIGDYTITVTYTNGMQESTVVPYPSLATVTMQPAYTVPEHGTLYCPTTPSSSNAMITLQWENIDPNANAVDLHRHHVGLDDWDDLGIYTDLFPADGPLSTRSAGPISFSPGTWGIEQYNDNLVFDYNTDGVLYIAGNDTRSEYIITVLEATQDEDSDGLLNWWEALYFGGPTNAVAAEDSDHDGQNNLEESITGMDPTSAASVFMITNCAPMESGFMIEWPSVSGRVYRTLWTDSLTNEFQFLETNIHYPHNSSTDTVHGITNSQFYKVEVRLQ